MTTTESTQRNIDDLLRTHANEAIIGDGDGDVNGYEKAAVSYQRSAVSKTSAPRLV